MEPLKGAVSPAAKFWRTATTSQKMALAAFVMAGLVIIGVIATVATRPSYAPLYSGLSQDDAAQIVGKLREQKVDYRLAGGGSAVEVQADKVYDVRLQLAEAGLPRGGNVGFELFDGNHVGLTEFGEHINYQRALQGELERTISELDCVESARVHLVMPESKLYLEEQTRPTASVVLKLRGGRVIGQQQVRGIVHLVSSAVEGLSPDDVKVLDTSGNILGAPGGMSPDSGGGGIALARLQMEREYERQVEQKVQSMLEEVAGPDKAVVRVNASIDFDSRETEESIYEPAADGKGVLDSQQQMQESYTGRGPAVASGIPGIASNSGARPANQPSVGGAGDGYQRVETTSKYQITKKVAKSIIAPGQVKRLSLALFVDQSVAAEQVKALEKAASAAAGIDAARGDQVVVESLPFAEPKKEEKAESGSKARELYVSVGKDAAAALLLVIFLVFVRSMLKPKSATVAVPRGAALAMAAAGAPVAAATAAAAGEAEVKRSSGNGSNPAEVLAGVDSAQMAQAIKGLLGDVEG